MKAIIVNIFIFLYLLLSNFFIYGVNDEIKKEYYNNILSGGKEKIIQIKDNIDKIFIENCNIDINMFNDYSKIRIVYLIENQGNNNKFLFAFPRLDAKINKIISSYIKDGKEDKKKSERIKGDYIDFSIYVDDKKTEYNIKEDDIVELDIPFKIGNSFVFKDSKNKLYRELVDSFYYTYSWYTALIQINSKEKKKIKITYTVPHYYNIIDLQKVSIKKSDIIGDPALKYISIEMPDKTHLISEKIFNYQLSTAYSKNEKSINTLIIRLKANIINQDHLDILPLNFRKYRNTYYWKFKNLYAKSSDNVQIKLSSLYSDNSIDQLCFNSTPEKIYDGLNKYYKLNRSNNEIILEHMNDNVNVSSIRLLPDYYDNIEQLKKINKPLEVEIEFSQNKNFKNSIKFNKNISARRFNRLVNKKSNFIIYKGKQIQCKFIKIKIIKMSNPEEPLFIRDIEILE